MNEFLSVNLRYIKTMNNLKKLASQAAIGFIKDGEIIGIGTGSTIEFFIKELALHKNKVRAAVSTSKRSTELLKSVGIEVISLNQSGDYPVYFDGADEVNSNLQMLKGRGGALTAEKICASAAKEFICIVDHTKMVKVLGESGVAVEIIPMAQSLVSRKLVKMGGIPKLRENLTTEHGNIIVDVYGFKIVDPLSLEEEINALSGVVCCGIFAKQKAHRVIVGQLDGSVSILK